ncbi:hypothetical protein [Alteromonas sp. a30]|uniref:hypothetical protein n=1 Tax=Alteromonas sp. a30 TaxID=2730917 RepID=UPI00227DD122|nr:hypothetical protein [Alteromonas sp. a30]MCY7294161.1 hypothetical protein [Alteromonas sp. a30]
MSTLHNTESQTPPRDEFESSAKDEQWQHYRGRIESKTGKWIGGDDVNIRGYSLFNDLFAKTSYMQILVLNATGRLISKELACWLENNFMCMSYPDSRIWCNQVGALHGSMRTTPTAATASGSLAADSRIYGGSQTSQSAMRYLAHAFQRYQSGTSIETLINDAPVRNGRPAIIGFARPVFRNDERIQPHREMSETLGFEEGEYMQFANALSHYLETHYSMGINIGGYTAAFMLDQGFSPKEVYTIKNMCVASGVTACYTDFFEKAEHSHLPQYCTDVRYTGPSPRPVPTKNRS